MVSLVYFLKLLLTEITEDVALSVKDTCYGSSSEAERKRAKATARFITRVPEPGVRVGALQRWLLLRSHRDKCCPQPVRVSLPRFMLNTPRNGLCDGIS